MFQIDDYPTLNQIKYRIRKIGSKFGITKKQELIRELMENNLEWKWFFSNLYTYVLFV